MRLQNDAISLSHVFHYFQIALTHFSSSFWFVCVCVCVRVLELATTTSTFSDGEPRSGNAGSREWRSYKKSETVPHVHPVSFYGSVIPLALLFVDRLCVSYSVSLSRCSSSSRPFLMGKITRLPVNEWWLSLSTLFNYLGYDMIEWLMERLNIEDSGEFPLLWKKKHFQFSISLVHFDMIILPIDSSFLSFDGSFFFLFCFDRVVFLFPSISKQNNSIRSSIVNGAL